MVVYVATKAKMFEEEIFLNVFANRKECEKFLRSKYPHMREINGSYVADKNMETLLFIKEVEI